ncbi:MAG: alpha/beta fold hydrolase [Alphaproteobacteria bacterium]|nr:alpha/beta fold hydrolase [Alphaproteobacteria bacterium]
MAPRPLGLHLTAAMSTWASSLGVLPPSSSASAISSGSAPPVFASPGLASLWPQLAAAAPDALRAAVDAEIRRRAAALAGAIAAYRRHPYRRAAVPWPVIWSEGTTRMLDCAPDAAAPPVLVIPSLVNRGYILDLLPERSFVRALAAAGFRPLLVDWDAPGDVERGFGLDAYVAGRLARALEAVRALGPGRPVVAGYCMGGLLALPLALQHAEALRGLVLLATPWDFHAERRDLAVALAAQARVWLPIVDALGELPVDGIQALFAGLDPFLVPRKFLGFAGLDPGGDKAREFVALEDWLNDGVPLAAPVARECLLDWYGDNATAAGHWRIAGDAVDPARLRVPSLVVVPEQDRIVPPRSALALHAALPGAAKLVPPLGHIGMVSSRRAPATLWPQVFDWLRALAP